MGVNKFISSVKFGWILKMRGTNITVNIEDMETLKASKEFLTYPKEGDSCTHIIQALHICT